MNYVLVERFGDFDVRTSIGLYVGEADVDQSYLDNINDPEAIHKYMMSLGYKKVKTKSIVCGGKL